MRYIYKVDSFPCAFAGRNRFSAQLQAMLDYYAQEGWRFRDMEIPTGELCTLVFEKQVEDPPEQK